MFPLMVMVFKLKLIAVNLVQEESVVNLLRSSGADPGFVVKGGVSRRGVWGPLSVPSGSKVEPW